jgi:hypothetical protein
LGKKKAFRPREKPTLFFCEEKAPAEKVPFFLEKRKLLQKEKLLLQKKPRKKPTIHHQRIINI